MAHTCKQCMLYTYISKNISWRNETLGLLTGTKEFIFAKVICRNHEESSTCYNPEEHHRLNEAEQF